MLHIEVFAGAQWPLPESTLHWAAVAATRPGEGDRVDPDELRARAAQIRSRHGIGTIAAAAAGARPIEDPRPNPKLVTPADLAASPSFSFASRVVPSS